MFARQTEPSTNEHTDCCTANIRGCVTALSLSISKYLLKQFRN